jgi:hypothetical protein
MKTKCWQTQVCESYGECGDDVAVFRVQNEEVKKTKEMIKQNRIMHRKTTERDRKENLGANLPPPVKSQTNLPRRVQPRNFNPLAYFEGCGSSARFGDRSQFDGYES